LFVPKKKLLSNEDFLERVRDYLPMDAVVWNTNAHVTPGSCAIACGRQRPKRFATDLEKSLHRLRRLNDRLPHLVANADFRAAA
jgi:hypothetical protein